MRDHNNMKQKREHVRRKRKKETSDASNRAMLIFVFISAAAHARINGSGDISANEEHMFAKV